MLSDLLVFIHIVIISYINNCNIINYIITGITHPYEIAKPCIANLKMTSLLSQYMKNTV